MASAGISSSSSSSSSPRSVGNGTNPVGRLRVGKKVKLSASKMIAAIASNRKRRSRAAAALASSTSHDRPCGLGRGTDADLGLGLGLPGPQFRPLHLCGGAYCFTAIDPAWGGGYAFYKRSKKKNGKWKPVFDEEMIWILTAAVTVGGSRTMAVAGPQRTLGGGIGGICTALRARDVELDVAVTANALSFLDCVSLSRSEAVSKTFRHDISRIAWNALANQLSREVKDRAKAKVEVNDGETIQSKDMVIYAQKEKIASDYAEEIANMSPEEFAEKGQLLSEPYPSKDDYDIYIRFSSGNRVLCQGFFRLVNDITIFGENDGFDNIINLDEADLSQWPEMKAFLECAQLPLVGSQVETENRIREAFDKLKPCRVAFTVVAIHKRSLQPSALFWDNIVCDDGEKSFVSHFEVDVEKQNMYADITMKMDFDAFHEGELDLNARDSVFGDKNASVDFRKLVEGNLSLKPGDPNRMYNWYRYCYLDFGRPGTWMMKFYDSYT